MKRILFILCISMPGIIFAAAEHKKEAEKKELLANGLPRTIQLIHEGPNKDKAGETWVGIDYANIFTLETIDDQLKADHAKDLPTVIMWVYANNPAMRGGAGEFYQYWPVITGLTYIFGKRFFDPHGPRQTEFSRYRQENRRKPENNVTPDNKIPIIGTLGFYVAYGQVSAGNVKEFFYIGDDKLLTETKTTDPNNGFQAHVLRRLLNELSYVEQERIGKGKEVRKRSAAQIMLSLAQIFDEGPAKNIHQAFNYYLEVRGFINKYYQVGPDEDLPFELERPGKDPKPLTTRKLNEIIEDRLAQMTKATAKEQPKVAAKKPEAKPIARPSTAAPAKRPSVAGPRPSTGGLEREAEHVVAERKKAEAAKPQPGQPSGELAQAIAERQRLRERQLATPGMHPEARARIAARESHLIPEETRAPQQPGAAPKEIVMGKELAAVWNGVTELLEKNSKNKRIKGKDWWHTWNKPDYDALGVLLGRAADIPNFGDFLTIFLSDYESRTPEKRTRLINDVAKALPYLFNNGTIEPRIDIVLWAGGQAGMGTPVQKALSDLYSKAYDEWKKRQGK